MAEDKDTEVIDVETVERAPFEVYVSQVLLALQGVAVAELAAGNGLTRNAWRALHDSIVDALGGEQLAHAVPVPGRPAFVVPPAKGGATLVPHRPPMAVPPQPRGPIPIGGNQPRDVATVQNVVPVGDIRKREDVAAELARVTDKTSGRKSK